MIDPESRWIGLATALGAGLLIGIERERRKGSGAHRAPAGVRTFALASSMGAGAAVLGQPLLVAVGALLIGTIAAMAYWRNRSQDPGATTALALLLTYVIGVLAPSDAILAAGSAVVVTALLASRHRLHRFSVEVLTETELRDALVFAAATLILLPLLPSRDLPWAAGVNPRRIWALVVLFMGLQAVGYVALRMFGARLGLALSGLAGGFVSSTGTIAALGARAREAPPLRVACVGGALLSSVATVVLLVVVILMVWPAALAPLAPSLGAALVAVSGAAAVAWRRQRGRAVPRPARGRPFNLLHALGFAALLSGVTVGVALVSRHFGAAAAATVTAVAGAFDVHAAAASTLALAADGSLATRAVRLPVLIAFTTNTVSKVVAAFVGGGLGYGGWVSLGLALMTAAAWAPLLVG